MLVRFSSIKFNGNYFGGFSIVRVDFMTNVANRPISAYFPAKGGEYIKHSSTDIEL
jgi:hypothetical protein